MSPARRTPRRRRRISLMALAGWLFADLLLVLTLVAMGDHADPLAGHKGRPHPSASASRSPKPSPSPTGPRSVEKVPVKFHVHGTKAKDIRAQVGRATARWKERQAALVLTFGGSSSGTQYAHTVNGALNGARSSMFTKSTVKEDFHDLGARPETAELWVYFYTLPK